MDFWFQHFLERFLGWFFFLNFIYSIYLLGTVEEQTKYCFDIYDLNEDGFISREEMMTMMKACMFKTGNTEEDGEDGVKVTTTRP